MVGIQFESISTTSDFNQILKLSGIEAVSYEECESKGAEIQVLDGLGYKKYYFINDAYDADDNEVEGDVWADADGYILSEEDVVGLGDGFWFRTKNADNGAVTVAGQVTAANELSIDFPGARAFYMLANPFPVATDLSNVAVEGATAVSYEESETKGAEIQVLNGLGYDKYYFINDAYDADDNEVEGDVWADADGYIVEGTQIDAGASFWIRSTKEGSLTFKLAK